MGIVVGDKCWGIVWDSVGERETANDYKTDYGNVLNVITTKYVLCSL